MNDTLCPIIFTSNELSEFIYNRSNNTIQTYYYSNDIIYDYINKLLKLHNILISKDLFNLIYAYYEQDIRKLINNLQLWLNYKINDNVLWNITLFLNPYKIENNNNFINSLINNLDETKFDVITKHYYNSINKNSNNIIIKNDYPNYIIESFKPNILYCSTPEKFKIIGKNFDNRIKGVLFDDYLDTDIIVSENEINLTYKINTIQCCRYYHINLLLSDGSIFPQYPNRYDNIIFICHGYFDSQDDFTPDSLTVLYPNIKNENENENESESKPHIIQTPYQNYKVNIKRNNNYDKDLEKISSYCDILSEFELCKYDKYKDYNINEYKNEIYKNMMDNNYDNV